MGDARNVRKNPTDLAGGFIDTDSLTDLAVSGTDAKTGRAAALVMLNTSTPGALSFSKNEVVVPSTSTAGAFTSIAVGVLRTTNNSNAPADVAATTDASTLAIMQNASAGVFTWIACQCRFSTSTVDLLRIVVHLKKESGVRIQELVRSQERGQADA